MRTIYLVYALIAIGGFCVIVDIMRLNAKCPESKIVYRYVPRTFTQDQDNPLRPFEAFKGMFDNPDPWISGVGVDTSTPRRSINEYWISQD